jgi:hypothetical protein
LIVSSDLSAFRWAPEYQLWHEWRLVKNVGSSQTSCITACKIPSDLFALSNLRTAVLRIQLSCRQMFLRVWLGATCIRTT